MPNTFVLSDGNLNRYGYRVLTEGIELDNFRKNPVMFYNHETRQMPIGKWANIRKDGGRLLADAVFDEKDELAQTVKSKVEQGIINATSLGFRVLALSEEKEHLLQGQRRPTVSSSEVTEVSIVNIPGNPTALKLEFDGLILSGAYREHHLDGLLPLIEQDEPKDNNEMDLKELNEELGLPADTDVAGIKAAFEAQKLRADESAENIVALGKKLGYVNDGNEKAIRKLAESDTGLAIDLFNAKSNQEEKLDNGGGDGEDGNQKKEDKGERLSDAVKELAAKAKKDGKEGDEKEDEPKGKFLTFGAVLDSEFENL